MSDAVLIATISLVWTSGLLIVVVVENAGRADPQPAWYRGLYRVWDAILYPFRKVAGE